MIKKMTKAERFIKDLDAEFAAAPLTPMVVPLDAAAQEKQRAQSTIQPDRSGRATTLLKNIVPDEAQPRKAKNTDPAEIVRLSDSIKGGEQIQPIVVDWWPELQKWKIVVGERRFMATKVAGLDRIACVFKLEKMDPIKRKLMQGAENIHRVGLSDLERAEYFKELIELTGWTQTRLAAEMNVSQATVSVALALLGETEELLAANNPSEAVDRDDVAKKIKQRKRKKKRRGAAPKHLYRTPFQVEPGRVWVLESTAELTDEEVERLARKLVDWIGAGRSAAA